MREILAKLLAAIRALPVYGMSPWRGDADKITEEAAADNISEEKLAELISRAGYTLYVAARELALYQRNKALQSIEECRVLMERDAQERRVFESQLEVHYALEGSALSRPLRKLVREHFEAKEATEEEIATKIKNVQVSTISSPW